MRPAATIRGVVTDAHSGAAIADITVRACGWSTCGYATTDITGAYTITELVGDDYSIEFNPSSTTVTYGSEYWENVENTGAATLITLRVGDHFVANADLLPAGTINGVVTDRLGTVESIFVYACRPGYSSCDFRTNFTWTNDSGAYALPGLGAGAWIIHFTEDSVHEGEYYDNQTYIESATPVTVTAGATTASINAQLARKDDIVTPPVSPLDPATHTPTYTPTKTPTITPTKTPTNTPSTTPTTTPTVTPTNTPTTTPTNTSTNTPTNTPETPTPEVPTPVTPATETPTPETPVDGTPTPTPTEPPTVVATVEVEPEQSSTTTVGSEQGLEVGQAVQISIPAGAVDVPTTLNFGIYAQPPASPPQFALGGFVFDISASQNGADVESLTFAQPVMLTIDYRDEDVTGLDESTLTLYFYNEATHEWGSDGITVLTRDPVNNRIVVTITHLTTFGLFDPSERSLLPLILGKPQE